MFVWSFGPLIIAQTDELTAASEAWNQKDSVSHTQFPNGKLSASRYGLIMGFRTPDR